MVCRFDVSAKIAAVDLGALAWAADFGLADFRRHRFPDFVRQNKARFVLHAEVAGEGQHRLALDFIREDRDRHQVSPQRQLMKRKQRAGGYAEILAAGFAAPAWSPVWSATGIDRKASAVRAISVAIVVRPPKPDKDPLGFLIRHARDRR